MTAQWLPIFSGAGRKDRLHHLALMAQRGGIESETGYPDHGQETDPRAALAGINQCLLADVGRDCGSDWSANFHRTAFLGDSALPE